MKKHRKLKIGIAVVIIIFIILIIVGINRQSQTNKLKELLELVECKYYKTTVSSEQGYKNDIYIGIPYNPIEENGKGSNQYYYEKMIQYVANALESGNYRLVDEERNIIIRIQFDGAKVGYSINGDGNYYETANAKEASKDQIANNTKIKVNSDILSSIIANKWSGANSKKYLGAIDSVCDGYDYYFDEGYKIKTKQSTIYNIVFNTNYTEEIFEDISIGMDNNEIIEVLGKPSFTGEDGNSVIGYKTNDFYAIFSEDEISIYKTEEFDNEKNTKFASIVSSFLEDEDYDKFIKETTELYPDYTSYKSENQETEIKYPQKGFKIVFNHGAENGIVLYNNYIGKITNDISIEDIKQGKSMPHNIYFHNSDYIFSNEQDRIAKDYSDRHSQTETRTTRILNQSDKFNIKTSDYITFNFYSKDKTNTDTCLVEKDLTTIFNITDNIFVYGKTNRGIYLYDATVGKSALWIADKNLCKINRIEDNSIYYDNRKADFTDNLEITNITTDDKYYSDDSMM